MLRLPALIALAVFLAPSERTCQAAVVTFTGRILSGNGATLGDVPPALDYQMTLDFVEFAPGLADIQSGMFNSLAADISLTGGNIFVQENGANDQALLLIDTDSPSGAFSVLLQGDVLANNRATRQNLEALINASPASLTADFGGGGFYSGSVTGVPEPNAIGCLVVAGFLTLRRRKRPQLNLPD